MHKISKTKYYFRSFRRDGRADPLVLLGYTGINHRGETQYFRGEMRHMREVLEHLHQYERAQALPLTQLIAITSNGLRVRLVGAE